MLKLRKILLCNYLFYIAFIFSISLTIIRINIPKLSNYNENSKVFTGIIIQIIEKEDKVIYKIKNKEIVIGTLYLKNKEKIEVHLGDKVKIIGTFQKPQKNTTKNLFNYQKYCKRNNIFYVINIYSLKVIKKNHNIYYFIKQKVINYLNKDPYLNTFLLGEKSYLKEEVKRSYQENGISHLFAISGMHITLLATVIEKLLKKFYFRLAGGGIFLYGNYARELMIKEGFNPDKLYVIHNSLDYDVQLSIRQSLQEKPIYQEHYGNDNKNIVFIGRLTKVKRFDLLIDAIVALKERGELVNVTFIGDGVERQNMETLVEKKGIRDQVWFYGACYDEKTNAELIYNADLCVSPGNIGLTAMHVLMFGCPAITNDDFNHQMPEFEAIQDGVTGAFFHAGDSTSLAVTISKWFAAHGENREEVRMACYKEIDEQWTPEFQIEILNNQSMKKFI